MQSAERSAFLAAATAWSAAGGDRHAARMLRSPFSGVPHELGAAYAALAVREGAVLDLLTQQRIADSDARDAVLRFTSALSALAKSGADEQRIAELFDLSAQGPGSTAGPAPDTIGLAEPVPHEAQSPVSTQNARFSASQLNTYVECARKWYYRYVCAAVEDKGSSASFYGTAFHAALEDFHGAFPQPGAADQAELECKALGYLNAAFDRHRAFFEAPVEYELQLRRARRTVKRYVQWLVAQAQRAPFTVIGCELPAELKLEGYDFIGYIDRLDRDDRTGNVAVIDYKTGSIANTAAEYREKVRAFKDFQLPFYYWARTEAGDRVSRLALIPLKDALLDVRPIELEVVPVPADLARSHSASGVIPLIELERARTRMVELCAELTGGKTSAFQVTSDADACTYCAYTLACINRPYPAEQHFAR